VAALKAKHQNTARDARATIQALESRKVQLQVEVDRLKLRLQTEKAEEQKLAHELDILRAEEAEIPRRVQELQRLIVQEEERAAHESSAVALASAEVRRHMEHLQSQLRVLEETLGLQIQQVPDKGLLRFVFVHLDPCDPPRPFSFTLQLTGQSTYVVHDCAPPVADLPALLGALSHNPNHFFSFVRGMRKAFKAGLLHG